MITFNLKRIRGNNSVIHGKLTIPQANFSCHTLELKDGSELQYKNNCCINVGNYQLKRGFDQMSANYPVFRYIPDGLYQRPRFMLTNGDYRKMSIGDIALGTKIIDNFSIDQPFDFVEKVKDAFEIITTSGEIMVLQVYKSRNYIFDDISFEQTLAGIEGMNFYEEEEDENEQPELA